MKIQLLLITALFALVQTANAQKTFKKAMSSSAGRQKIAFVVAKTDLEIVGYAGNEVVIEAEDYEGPPERAKGLKPLYNRAIDNTGIGLEVQEAGGVMTIKKASYGEVSYKIKVPASADISIEEQDWDDAEFSIKDVSGEIEFTGNNSGITLTNVTGPVVANTTNGSIAVVFSRVNQEKPSHLSATNGEIDVTMPADTKANVELSSINGEAYSDFDVKFPENDKNKGMKILRNQEVEGTINGGGVELSLNTINDNIYLRKK